MTSKFATDAASWVFGPGGGGGGSAPATGGGGHGKAHAPTGGGGGGAAPASKDTEDAVRTMQKLMMDLGSQLSQPAAAQTALTKLQKESPNTQLTADYIQGMARKFSNTAAAGLGRSPTDGVWGKNTRDVLLLIKTLISNLGIKDIILSEGTGPSPYKTNDDLLTLAKQNIDNLSRLFGAVGITTTVQEVANSTGTMVVDMIDITLPQDGVNNPFAHWNDHPVMVSDLTNLTAFFEFTRGLKPPFPCTSLDQTSGGRKKPAPKPTAAKAEPRPAQRPTTASFEEYMQKLAEEVLDRSIYRLGQEAPLASAIAPAAAPESSSDPHCVSVLDEIIKWFKERSSQMFDSIYSSYSKSRESPRPDRKGKVGTLLDAQLADYYVRQMGKISDEWGDVRNSVIDLLRENGDSPIVTSRVLREALGGSGSGSNRGKAHGDERGGHEVDSSGRTVHDQSNPPPLANFMSMQNFEDYAPNSLDQVRKLTDGDTLPELDIRKWNSSWMTLAQEVAGATDAEKYKNFGPWARAIKNTLTEVYRNWKGERHNDDELKRQYDFLSRWIARINATLGTYSDTYLEQMERARRGR